MSDDAERAALRDTLRDFAEREIRPIAAELDESERFPAELYTRLCALGMMGITVPQALGGAGADVRAYAVAMRSCRAAMPRSPTRSGWSS